MPCGGHRCCKSGVRFFCVVDEGTDGHGRNRVWQISSAVGAEFGR